MSVSSEVTWSSSRVVETERARLEWPSETFFDPRENCALPSSSSARGDSFEPKSSSFFGSGRARLFVSVFAFASGLCWV